ncbi:hypothetical protein [Amycolatopsis sp. NPDC021455]|uniref:hypothetical protein n=1 Tax=Amycolatopsis sp. NPDC021455 TaxID=3154901 RepID=UPI00341057D7
MAVHTNGATSGSGRPDPPKVTRVQAAITGFNIVAVLIALTLFGTWHLRFLSTLDNLDALREHLVWWLLVALVPGTTRFLWTKAKPTVQRTGFKAGEKILEFLEESRNWSAVSKGAPTDDSFPAQIDDETENDTVASADADPSATSGNSEPAR